MSVELGWDMIVWGDLTLRRLIQYAAIAVAAYIGIKIFKKLFFKKKINLQNTVYFVCRHCDWEGQISKFGTHCPKCNHPIH
jgi:hypothetical protein